jgi:hypothetical protein
MGMGLALKFRKILSFFMISKQFPYLYSEDVENQCFSDDRIEGAIDNITSIVY